MMMHWHRFNETWPSEQSQSLLIYQPFFFFSIWNLFGGSGRCCSRDKLHQLDASCTDLRGKCGDAQYVPPLQS